jgi:SAM-dependent methyltransferase
MSSGDVTQNEKGIAGRHRDEEDQPPYGSRWLEAHHLAKLAERQRFAERLAEFKPRSVLDLGCGPGMWLDLLHGVLPADCSFIGVDIDESLLEVARQRSRSWPQSTRLEVLDLETEVDRLPVADITLMFNVISYLSHPLHLLEAIAGRDDGSIVAIRDGSFVRFGPMTQTQHIAIEEELQRNTARRPPFRHMDLDRTYTALTSASFAYRQIEFELFERSSPFPPELEAYLDGTLWWTANHLSPKTAAWLERWRDRHQPNGEAPAYLFEVDVVAVLRSSL